MLDLFVQTKIIEILKNAGIKFLLFAHIPNIRMKKVGTKRAGCNHLNFLEFSGVWLKKLNLVKDGTKTDRSEKLFKPTSNDLRQAAEVFRYNERCMVLCLVKYMHNMYERKLLHGTDFTVHEPHLSYVCIRT